MDVITQIFDVLGDIVNGFGTLLTNIFNTAVSLFYTPGVEGAPGSLTVLGVFMLIGLGTGLLIWGFNFIRSLIRIRRG